MKTHEHTLVATTKDRAMVLIRTHFVSFRKKHNVTDWMWITKPEAKKYAGKSKKLMGLWQAYARISYER